MKIKMNLLFLMLGISLVGCSGATQIFVLEEKEIIVLKEGEMIKVPYDGTFYSTRAEKRVMNARKIKQDLK